MNDRRAPAALLLALWCAPAVASAQIADADRTTARTLGQEGHAALDKKAWATALDRFRRADALVHAPTFLLGMAQAQVGLGQLVSALETYNRIVREALPRNPPAPFVKALEVARRELDELAPRIPYVIIEVTGAAARTAKVTLDGVEVPAAAVGVKRAVDPGPHAIRATADGFAPAAATLTSVERKTDPVTLEPRPQAGPAPGATGPAQPLAAPSDAPGSTQRTVGVVGLAAGGAGLAVGAVLGGLVIAQHADLLKSCPLGHCPVAQQAPLQGRLDGYHALSAGATAGFIAGGALAATGVVLLLAAPSAAPAGARGASWRTLQPVLGLGYAGAEGSF